MGTRFKRAVLLHNLSPLLPCAVPQGKKERNKQRETQSDLVGRDDLKEEKGKNTGKIANERLNTDHFDNIKVNQKHDFKKIRIAAEGKISVINNHASDEQIILSFYRTVPTDCEVCVTIQPLSYCQSFSADSCREKW